MICPKVCSYKQSWKVHPILSLLLIAVNTSPITTTNTTSTNGIILLQLSLTVIVLDVGDIDSNMLFNDTNAWNR